MTTYLHFPELIGLGYDVTWRAVWSGEVQEHQSGGEYRFSYWSEPLWEFDLTFNVLREGFWIGQPWDELRKLVGLNNACLGTTQGFKFKNVDDFTVPRQYIGTTDGTTTTFDLVRTYGANNPALGYNGTEHIGFLSDRAPFSLFIDSSSAAVSVNDPTYGYTLGTGTPSLQQLVFNAAPPAGHLLYVQMSYDYFARFKDATVDFDKFMQRLWQIKKVTLRTLRQESVTTS
jgi:Conserved hypothetical protein 2217 (DUF2460)